MKSFLSSLRKLDSSNNVLCEKAVSNKQFLLLPSLFKKSRAIDRSMRKGLPGISLSLYTSLLTIGTSIGIGITLNPQNSWAGSTCVGTYSSRSGVAIDASGAVVSSTTNSVIGYFNSITNSYVPLVNYTGGSNINAIATQPSTGNLFFVNRTTGKIVVYNPNTGTQTTLTGTLLGITGLPSPTTIIGATFDASGKLYIYYGAIKSLIQIDPSTGSTTGSLIPITGIPGNSTGGTNGDIAVGTNGTVYALGDTGGSGTAANDYTSRLYSIVFGGTATVPTATATAVVASNITGLGGSAANGLAIDPATGKVYISSSLGTYELNTTTNAATQLTNATGTNDLASCGAPTPDLPTITKSFSPGTVIGTPANSTLTLTVGNTNQVPIYLISTLIDNLQTGLAVRSPNGLGGTCLDDTANSSKVTAVASSSSISLLNGLKVPAGGCTVTVDVTASNVGTFTNTIAAGALKTTAGNNLNATTDTLTVTPPPNFGLCPAQTYITQGVNVNSIKLNSVDLLTGVLSPISASNFPSGVNAIGFNQLDNYIYGIKSSSGNVVVRIDANGVGYELGAIPGLPLADYNSGDVNTNGILYVKAATATTAYGIDLNPASPTYLTIVKTVTGLISSSDFAFHPTNGKLYTIQDATSKVYEISWPAAGATVAATLVDRGKPTNLPIGTYGAIYFASDGSMYGYSNGTVGSNNGAIYRMTNVVGTGLPVATALTTSATGVSSNDGARCPLAPPIVPPTTLADVKLIKRITAINGDRVKNPNDPTKPLNQVLDNPATANDNAGVNWPNTSSFSLLGAYQPGLIKPDDVIEYTIYFLNASGADANAIKICDRIVGSQQFVADAYGLGQDIEYKLGANATQYLTGASVAGIDRAEFNSSTAAIAGCPSPTITGPNNGTVTIDVTGTGSTGQVSLPALPGATAPGVPSDSYGYFRFKVKVNP
jgi:sugar lactone lactonase YvrE